MSLLKAGVIGIGSMGKNHARVYSEMNSTELVAVSDPNKSLLSEFKKKYGVSTYSDYREMLKREDLDIVSVAVPTSLHLKVAGDALKKKINVLVEKPIAPDEKTGRKLAGIAAKEKTKLMVGHIERFNPAVLELRKRLERKELGKIFEISIDRLGPFPPRIRDTGVVVDLAVHDFDIAPFLCDSMPKSIFSFTEKKIHTKHEDLMISVLELSGEIPATIRANWLTPMKKRTLSVLGQKGLFSLDFITQELWFFENAAVKESDSFSDFVQNVAVGKSKKLKVRKSEPLLNELEAFAQCVIRNKPVPVSAEEGILAVRTAKAALKSSKSGRTVKI